LIFNCRGGEEREADTAGVRGRAARRTGARERDAWGTGDAGAVAAGIGRGGRSGWRTRSGRAQEERLRAGQRPGQQRERTSKRAGEFSKGGKGREKVTGRGLSAACAVLAQVWAMADRWSKSERSRLVAAVQTHGSNWEKVSSMVGGKSAESCFDRANADMEIITAWAVAGDGKIDFLTNALKKQPLEVTVLDTMSGSQKPKGAAADISVDDSAAIKAERRTWQPEEDQAIIKLVNELGQKRWSAVALQMRTEYGLKPRTGKQCRERYNNHLNPNIRKDPWTPEEETIVRQKQAELGNRWSDIARYLEGRSDNQVKNFYYALVRPVVAGTRKTKARIVDTIGLSKDLQKVKSAVVALPSNADAKTIKEQEERIEIQKDRLREQNKHIEDQIRMLDDQMKNIKGGGAKQREAESDGEGESRESSSEAKGGKKAKKKPVENPLMFLANSITTTGKKRGRDTASTPPPKRAKK